LIDRRRAPARLTGHRTDRRSDHAPRGQHTVGGRAVEQHGLGPRDHWQAIEEPACRARQGPFRPRPPSRPRIGKVDDRACPARRSAHPRVRRWAAVPDAPTSKYRLRSSSTTSTGRCACRGPRRGPRDCARGTETKTRTLPRTARRLFNGLPVVSRTQPVLLHRTTANGVLSAGSVVGSSISSMPGESARCATASINWARAGPSSAGQASRHADRRRAGAPSARS